MRGIEGRNVHQILPVAIKLLTEEGVGRQSRNGPVLMAPWPVTTTYDNPLERVLFWEQRDANPFFHLYESLWMLSGRQDIAPLVKYAKQMAEYSDDGVTQNGAYGYRWRKWFGRDQLALIAKRLKANPEDRRCMLQMWDAKLDLDSTSKDVPCNTMATFQRDVNGHLDLTVFCRSNDIVWGCYGANAVHFSFLLEYMALWIGCPVGKYRQVSVNWHGYLSTLEKVKDIPEWADKYETDGLCPCPYTSEEEPVIVEPLGFDFGGLDEAIERLLVHDSTDFQLTVNESVPLDTLIETAYTMLLAHQAYRLNKGEDKYSYPMSILNGAHEPDSDWIRAGREWILRRKESWMAKNS